MKKSTLQLLENTEPTFPPEAWARFWTIAFEQDFLIQAKEAAAQGEQKPAVTTPLINPELSLPPGIRP